MTAATNSPSSSRALVTLAPNAHDAHDAHPHRSIPRAATFLTHLIATARQLPQTRERRRAEPSVVIAAYQATIARSQKFNDQ